ncbi:Putative 2-acylglycerophosphoethanolamine acyltransferase / acyl-acyl carrier protein synthetase [hydrothermal vent metagenome]|uniref:Putative 2-acylglycerophosphoethanolamine acyltransferase / acyl-acyl carrier protein synthetase n=1 Tax=hydrothermal vent metagenome TaxID=652676 RepID=A0A1W1CVH2_9ZZZZ
MFKIIGSINYLFVVFLNAFTDLGHKIIIQNTIFKVYDGPTQIVLTAIVNALILLPFILVFSPSGFLADRFAKNKIMEYAALFAVFITLGITYAYYHGHFLLAFSFTFILALQSAIYAPAKYGYIKELFTEKYLSGGNGAVQAVTTVAILGGIIFYTVLFEGMYSNDLVSEDAILQAVAPIGWFLVGGSVIEWFLASKLPNKMQSLAKKRFNIKKYLSGYYLMKNLKTVTRKKEIFEAIIALGLFWSISQVVLAIFGEYAKDELGITNTIYVQGAMALAGIGIVIGSIAAAKLSKYYINLGLSVLGAVGITLIVFSIPFIHSFTLIAISFTIFGLLSGFILVPLSSNIQHLASNIHLGTIIAANNFIQNIFMFLFLLLTTLFAYFGMNAELLFYLMGVVGIYLSVILFRRYYVDAFWALMEIFASLRHRYIYHGLENIPEAKAVLLLGNHVSWLDWIILQLPLKRRINYMMDKEIYHWPILHAFFKEGEAIPLSPRAFKDAFGEAHKRLLMGRIVGIFPEGAISKTGELGEFKRGYELIKKDYDGVIVPFYIDSGVFGSIFSKYKPKNAKLHLFKRRVIHIYFDKPIAKETSSEALREIIGKMREKYETKQTQT